MTNYIKPDYIFESSWEVCNMVGGIYTVLSTRAATLTERMGDKLIFIGPDVWTGKTNPFFEEDNQLLSDWKKYTSKNFGLEIRIGRWLIPGSPLAVLVEFQPLMEKKDEIYGEVWMSSGVNSIAAYGDYDESSMFGYASGMLVESYYKFFKLKKSQQVIAHFNEWMTSFGVFRIQKYLPEIATVFTTHATSIGRSIAGNHKPLYDFLNEYNGDQMAEELNMVSKHSTEKQAAHLSDCFTTVSEITGIECDQLLDKVPDVITPNGFEDDFVPKGAQFTARRKSARKTLLQVAESLMGYHLEENALFIGTAGRYEFKNKGLDVLIESLRRLSDMHQNQRQIVTFIMVPAWTRGHREELANCLKNKNLCLYSPNHFSTHELQEPWNDPVSGSLHWFHLNNSKQEKIKVVFVPAYLNGTDGIFNKTYYDLLIGLDLTVFPSYYEPWGYTPLESVAFSVPTITTDLSGFGEWVSKDPQGIESGVGIVHRSDYNAYEAGVRIAEMIGNFAGKDETEIKKIRKNSFRIAEKALWKNFITYYDQAYHIALTKKDYRLKTKSV